MTLRLGIIENASIWGLVGITIGENVKNAIDMLTQIICPLPLAAEQACLEAAVLALQRPPSAPTGSWAAGARAGSRSRSGPAHPGCGALSLLSLDAGGGCKFHFFHNSLRLSMPCM